VQIEVKKGRITAERRKAAELKKEERRKSKANVGKSAEVEFTVEI
jgi:hypothetical protein